MNYFGQQPLAALKPLLSGQNLSDVADKALGRDNLEVFSRDETMLHAVPIGTVISFWGETAPVGYLPCFGQTINSGTFPDLVEFLNPGQPSATVPELRGEFLRGWDNGRGVDLGRAIKTAQADEFRSHRHPQYEFDSGNTVPIPDGSRASDLNANSTVGYDRVALIGYAGGTETRPRNVSVLYCIKAYGAVINESTVDIGNVLTDLSTAVRTTQFESSLTGNGYQKLPGGLIMQWGTALVNYNQTNTVVSFPIAFPNACLNASATVALPTFVSGVIVVHAHGLTPTSLSLLGEYDTNTLLSVPTLWFAIGY